MSHPEATDRALSAVSDNLTELDLRQSRTDECRLFHLEEWAHAAASKSREEEDLLWELLAPGHPGEDTPFSRSRMTEEVLPENRPYLQKLFHSRSIHERLFVLKTLRQCYPPEKWPEPWPGAVTAEQPGDNAREKIAYQQNTYTDAAYLAFARSMSHPRAAYFDRVTDVCEEVYNGICQYGILPIHHSEGGRLFRFYELLGKFELHLTAVCDIPTRENDRLVTVRYGLISKTLPLLSRILPLEKPCWQLELAFPPDPMLPLCDLLCAAEDCGLSTGLIDSRHLTDEEDLSYLIAFQAGAHSDPDTFLAFLPLDAPRAFLLGFYPLPS